MDARDDIGRRVPLLHRFEDDAAAPRLDGVAADDLIRGPVGAFDEHVRLNTDDDAGGRIVAAGPGKSIEGEPPKARIAIQIWDSPEKMMAWRNSAEYKKAREVGNKLAKFRSFYVEGAPN